MNKFTSISLYGVDTSGLNFVIKGIWEGEKFEVEMNITRGSDNVEFDSSPTFANRIDPFEDNIDAVKALTQDKRFIDLVDQGQKIRNMLLKIQK